MNIYKKLNNLLGWAVFTFASLVYILTSEPTASFWDCGEYIATAMKLQVGHPPGAPLFQMIGRFFSLFAFGNVQHVARMVNTMSALCSGFTILFLFWSITHLARKIIVKHGEFSKPRMYAVLASGLVGALAYTFSDSFWFSAVEGEVYAMSSFFTAIVFWAILKWEDEADEKYALRWLILIAYLMGLSIGVHLLNLLTIPAITFVYYFKKYKNHSFKNIVLVFIISIIILAGIMNGIIPWIVKLAGLFELFFVNSVGLPFNWGTIIYFILLIGGIVWGLKYTRRHKKVVANTIILAFTFILIGYSSFLMLVIRSNTNTPINENNPSNAIGLLSYLNREQYGDWPLLTGQYFNAPSIDAKDGKPVYERDNAKGKYVISNDKKGTVPVYDPRFTTLFPRMWSSSEQSQINEYKRWGKIQGTPIQVETPDGTQTINKPTFTENLRFFFSYQIRHMYYRYFMWNFVGKQNDTQGFGNNSDGNWISGISFMDNARLGPQDNLPDSMKSKGTNKFYFLPLILGLIGLYYHYKTQKNDTWVVALLFVMTGLAIVVYLNQYCPQPRERDYAYAGSFYAFAIWIGLGVLALYDWISRKLKPMLTVILVTFFTLILVPGIMGQQGWDDHDRSGRYSVLEIAKNYLNSCAPNAVLFTIGDNDTFPLWYAQEVEGIRTDVRVVNLSLLSGSWYVDQMTRKAYDSDPVPFSMKHDQYRDGNRDYVVLYDRNTKNISVSVKDIINFIADDNNRLEVNNGKLMNYIPSKKMYIPVDSNLVVANGTVPKAWDDSIVPVNFEVKGNGLTKNYLMLLDFLATNNWKRPVYFSSPNLDEAFSGLSDYLYLEGLAYHLIPVKVQNDGGQVGGVNSQPMYDNFMNKFTWGNMNNPKVYLDETHRRMALNVRNNFGRLADQLAVEGKKDKAIAVGDKCQKELPDNCLTYDYYMLPLAEAYYKAGAFDKGNKLFTRLLNIYQQNLAYYYSLDPVYSSQFNMDKQQALAVLQRIGQVAKANNQKALETKALGVFEKYYGFYVKENKNLGQ